MSSDASKSRAALIASDISNEALTRREAGQIVTRMVNQREISKVLAAEIRQELNKFHWILT